MIRAAAIVAHPDDCVIFAWPLMRYLKHLEWSVVYLTYTDQDPRAQEIKLFWESYGVDTRFLGYNDDYRDIESGTLSFDAEQARNDIQKSCCDFDLVVTHGPDGEHGHPHHRFMHSCVKQWPGHKVYFANYTDKNFEIDCKETHDLDLLPLHRTVIDGFRDRYTGRYWAPLDTMEALGWAH